MTDTFRELERGHEAKYKLDEELRFKIRCRRNKLFGRWAADHLGYVDGAAESYARMLVRHELDQGHVDVVDRVLADLAVAGARVAERDVRQVLALCEAEAMEQILDAYPTALDTDHVQVGG